jgi:DNA-binding IscR family transcriptional regulator
MVTTRDGAESLATDILEKLFGTPQTTDTPTVDVERVIESDLNFQKVKSALNDAEKQADNFFEDWQEAEDEYKNLLDEIEDADEVDAENLKRRASRKKRRANKLKEDYDVWVAREDALSQAFEEIQSAVRTKITNEKHDEVFDLLEDGTLEDIINGREEDIEQASEITEAVANMTGHEADSVRADFSEVEKDLAEREWEQVESDGTNEYGDDLLNHEDDDEEMLSGGAVVDD